MKVHYACVATVERDGLTLKGLRADFANPGRLVGCGEFTRLAARDFTVAGRGELIEVRFTITHFADIGEAAGRAAELVHTLARGERLHAPITSLALTVEQKPTAAATPSPGERRTRCS
jgi:hypothetical protein